MNLTMFISSSTKICLDVENLVNFCEIAENFLCVWKLDSFNGLRSNLDCALSLASSHYEFHKNC